MTQPPKNKPAAKNLVTTSDDDQDKATKSAASTEITKSEEPTSAPAIGEQRFSLDRLAEDPERFVGHPQHVLVGAFAESEGTDEITITEARARIQEWLGSPIGEDPNKESDSSDSE